jgi:SAM-dependent methyltransferase
VTSGAARSPERLRVHYRVERRLADKLRRAPDAEARRRIFATMYDDLFREVPDHPRLRARSEAAAQRAREIDWDLAQLRPYLEPGCTFLEVGAGDCALSERVAEGAKAVYAVDISDQSGRRLPPNVRAVISDGTSIPVPPGTVDLAFSDQLMEHLHPDDAQEQLRNIHAALAPGGVYVCLTPNRLNGPHDISREFSQEPEGFHLKEYTLTELEALFLATGFRSVAAYARAKNLWFRVPVRVLRALEALLHRMPDARRRALANRRPLRRLLAAALVATK